MRVCMTICECVRVIEQSLCSRVCVYYAGTRDKNQNRATNGQRSQFDGTLTRSVSQLYSRSLVVVALLHLATFSARSATCCCACCSALVSVFALLH